MEQIISFWNYLLAIETDGIMDALQRTLILAALSGFVFYLLYLLLTKFVFSRSSDMTRDRLLRFNLLRSLILLMTVFALYFFFVVRANGLEKFKWAEPGFYLDFMPQLTVFLGTITLFYIFYSSYTKSLTSK